MKIWKQLLTVVLVMFYLPIAAAQSPVGTWTTIDDKTGQKRAIVELSVNNGTLSGTIKSIFPQPGDTGICSKCPGAFKDKPIKGLRFVWGLKDKGDGVWSDGQILDAKSGKIYHAKMTIKGDKLYVRGYVGISLFGRTQIWTRG